MSSYSKIAHEHKRAHSMFLELRARGFEILARESPEDLTGYAISLVGPAYDDELLQRIKANKPGLLKILLNRWDPDLEVTPSFGCCKVGGLLAPFSSFPLSQRFSKGRGSTSNTLAIWSN